MKKKRKREREIFRTPEERAAWEEGWETRQRELLRRYELARAEVEAAKRKSA